MAAVIGAVAAVAINAPLKLGTPNTVAKAPAAVADSFKSNGDAVLPLGDKLNSGTLLKVVVPNATAPDKVRLTVSIKKLVKLMLPVEVVRLKPLPACAIVPANEADKSPPVIGNRTTGKPPTTVAVALPKMPTVTPALVRVGAETSVTVVKPPTTGRACACPAVVDKMAAKLSAATDERDEIFMAELLKIKGKRTDLTSYRYRSKQFVTDQSSVSVTCLSFV